jgi:hypothetical protein
LLKCLVDQAGIDIGVVQPLRQAMAHGRLQPIMAEDRRKNEAAERRLGLERGFRFTADRLPDRIDRLDPRLDLGFRRCRHVLSPCRLRLELLRHGDLPTVTSPQACSTLGPVCNPDAKTWSA